MRFLILGGQEIRTPGKQIVLSAPKQRAILTAFLLDAGNHVPISRLVRFIWDDRPPATAQATLQSYVYRLRRALRPLPVEIRSAGEGYLLDAGPADVDLWHFRNLVGEAAEHARHGRLREAAAELRRALALWRGEALSGVPGKLVQQEARLLEGERIAAYEELFTTEIGLGGHRRIIPELQKVVSAHPFHESLRALLMLALYSSGRQVEALQHFAQIRRRLRDHLGIEPGRQLQELYRSILEQLPAEEIGAPPYGPWASRAGRPEDPLAPPKVSRP